MSDFVTLPFIPEIAQQVDAAADAVLAELGCGMFERIYLEALTIELQHRQIEFVKRKTFKIFYRSQEVGLFQPDLLIENHFLVLCKSSPQLQCFDCDYVRTLFPVTQARYVMVISFYYPETEWHLFERKSDHCFEVCRKHFCPDFEEAEDLECA